VAVGALGWVSQLSNDAARNRKQKTECGSAPFHQPRPHTLPVAGTLRTVLPALRHGAAGAATHRTVHRAQHGCAVPMAGQMWDRRSGIIRPAPQHANHQHHGSLRQHPRQPQRPRMFFNHLPPPGPPPRATVHLDARHGPPAAQGVAFVAPVGFDPISAFGDYLGDGPTSSSSAPPSAAAASRAAPRLHRPTTPMHAQFAQLQRQIELGEVRELATPHVGWAAPCLTQELVCWLFWRLRRSGRCRARATTSCPPRCPRCSRAGK
jgi:hypothetical protein